MKYANKPYRCSKCFKPMHMKRTVKLSITTKSKGCRPCTKQVLYSPKPDFCVDCYEEFKDNYRKWLKEFLNGNRKTEKEGGGDNPELSVPLHSEGQKTDDEATDQQCDRGNSEGTGE